MNYDLDHISSAMVDCLRYDLDYLSSGLDHLSSVLDDLGHT